MRITHWCIDEEKRYMRHFWNVYSSNKNPDDPTDEKNHGQFSVEYKYLSKGHGLCVRLKVDTSEIDFSLHLGYLLSLWIKVESWAHLRGFTERIIGKEYPKDRELSIWFHDHLMSATLWRPSNHHHRGDRRNILWNWHTWLFGRPVINREELWREPTTVHMPEGPYEAEVIASLVTKTWKRFKKTEQWRAGEIKVATGIPRPGKGENSWDCGDGATYSLSQKLESGDAVNEMVRSLKKSVERDRLRYGGPNWLPKPRGAK